MPFMWDMARTLFGGHRQSNHEIQFNATNSENGIPLYQSPAAQDVVANRRYDYHLSFFIFMRLCGVKIAILPVMYMIWSMPRRISERLHFCYKAELMPHTEQIMFWKCSNFGDQIPYIVDIKNLEKVSAEDVQAPLMWENGMYDKEMCFRDTETDRFFVFDKNGMWN